MDKAEKLCQTEAHLAGMPQEAGRVGDEGIISSHGLFLLGGRQLFSKGSEETRGCLPPALGAFWQLSVSFAGGSRRRRRRRGLQISQRKCPKVASTQNTYHIHTLAFYSALTSVENGRITLPGRQNWKSFLVNLDPYLKLYTLSSSSFPYLTES